MRGEVISGLLPTMTTATATIATVIATVITMVTMITMTTVVTMPTVVATIIVAIIVVNRRCTDNDRRWNNYDSAAMMVTRHCASAESETEDECGDKTKFHENLLGGLHGIMSVSIWLR